MCVTNFVRSKYLGTSTQKIGLSLKIISAKQADSAPIETQPVGQIWPNPVRDPLVRLSRARMLVSLITLGRQYDDMFQYGIARRKLHTETMLIIMT